MYIDSDSPQGSYKSTVDERRNASAVDREALANLVSRAISEHVVDDAPHDLDEVMSQVRQSSGRVRLLVLVSALAGLWTLIILGVRALLH